MSVAVLTHPLVFGALATAVDRVASTPVATTQGAIPEELRTFLARIRLLEGVPFSHLVPDAELLPPESIRFFHLDREWTDALVEGALSVGTLNTLDREQLQALHARVRDAVDTEERRVRVVGTTAPGFGPAGAITGFLLRSAAVSGWPGLHVRAYASDVDDEVSSADTTGLIRLIRLERLAPAVLLCLFDGVPRVVHIEEPRAGVQFGVDLAPGAEATMGARVPLRDSTTAAPLRVGTAPRTVEVPFRRGAPGVIHVRQLANRIADVPETHITTGTSADVDAGEMALQLLQFPFRQVFGPTGGGGRIRLRDMFHPTVALRTLRDWNGGER